MTDKEKKSKIADILLEFYEEYQCNMPNRPMIPSLYASKIIDTMQEESVSVWHDANEEQPEEYSTVVVWNPITMDGDVLTRCVEVYKGRIWAYIEDLLNLSNVQKTTKNRKEPDKWEPQTGDTFRKKGTTSPTYHLCDKREDGITFGFVENREVGIAGGEITIFALQQDYELVERPKSIEDVVEEELNKGLQTKVGQKTKDESTNEDLGDYINELSKQFPEVSFGKLSRIAVRVSKWQQNQDVKNKLPKVTDRTELDEYAYQCAYDISNDWLREKPTWKDVEDACKLGAEWQRQKDEHLIWQTSTANYEKGIEEGKQQMMKDATEVTVHIDAGGYPYIPQMELYDYDKDIPLAKEGDKYNVILIKED